MRVFTEVSEIPADFGPAVVAIGKFDGVHSGHQAILRKALADAAALGARTVAVTFDRNPLSLLRPELCPLPLVGEAKKIELLARSGIDAALVLRFDKELASMSPEDFIRRILVDALQVRTVLVGHDFRFGHRGSGTPEMLAERGRELGFTVDVVGDIAADGRGRRVSSTWIREMLTEGDVARAAELLDRPHSVRGEVVHGLKRGRELGFPTANLGGDVQGFVPADGVYAGWLLVAGERLPAAISVGSNPTFADVERQVEAYVLDAEDLDLYGETVEVEFVARIRGMVAFEGVPQLIAQMRDDVVRTREILAAAAGL